MLLLMILDGFGLALPGLLERARGAVRRSVNLPVLEGQPIRDDLARDLGIPVTLTTDAEATGWAEYHVRRPKPHRFVHLRLGTGIACGVVIDGQLLRLDEGRTGHLPTLVVDHSDNALSCTCGRRGCLETLASGAVLLEQARAIGGAEDLAQLQTAVERGDQRATIMVEQAAAALAAAYDNLTAEFQAKIITVGGGVMNYLPILFDLALEHYRSAHRRPGRAVSATVEPARLDNDAGVIGAAMLATIQP